MELQVGVKVFLKKGNAYLLLKRSSEKYSDVTDCWDIPGGRIDPGSSLVENLRREVLEETALSLTSEPVLLYAQDIILSAKHVVRLTYIANAEGEPTLDEAENTAYTWVTLKDMGSMPDLDRFVREILEKGLLAGD